MTIAQLVTGPPIGCPADTPLAEGAEMMVEETVGSLAVMDGPGSWASSPTVTSWRR